MCVETKLINPALQDGSSYGLRQIFWVSGNPDKPQRFYLGSELANSYSDADVVKAYETAIDMFVGDNLSNLSGKICVHRNEFQTLVQQTLKCVL